MKEWLDDFYGSDETRQALNVTLGPLFAQLGAEVASLAGSEVGVTAPAVSAFISSVAQTYIANYLDSSRVQLTELLGEADPRAAIEARLQEWVEKRPGKVADEATFKSANAVTQTVYQDAGVTRKRWNATGKSCPYCRRMDGKVVDIERPFHREGDVLEVPDSEIATKAQMNFTHEIGHPPQHSGCDCVIEAELVSEAPYSSS